MEKYLIYVLTVTVLILGYAQYKNQQTIDQLECDLVDAFFAEREYTYPALREMGYEPNDTALNIQNPITTSPKYADGCN